MVFDKLFPFKIKSFAVFALEIVKHQKNLFESFNLVNGFFQTTFLLKIYIENN